MKLCRSSSLLEKKGCPVSFITTVHFCGFSDKLFEKGNSVFKVTSPLFSVFLPEHPILYLVGDELLLVLFEATEKCLSTQLATVHLGIKAS